MIYCPADACQPVNHVGNHPPNQRKSPFLPVFIEKKIETDKKGYGRIKIIDNYASKI